MAIYQSKKKTKDGRSWFFRIKYKDVYGNSKDYTSSKFKLKREAEDAESKYRLSMHLASNITSIKKFNDLFDEYQEKMKNELKEQTIIKNQHQYSHLKPIIGNLTVKQLDIKIYNQLIVELKNLNFSVPYTNKILGLVDRLIQYSAKFYGVNSDVPKICGKLKGKTIKKEMLFFTYDEYKKFDTVIDEHLWHTFFEFLYYMGTRQGETTALSWEDINFEKKEVRINKTLTTKIKGEKWTISTPKTKNSNRTLPLTEKLAEDLKTLKNEYMAYDGFNDLWFVFGGVRPLPETTIQKKKNGYCDLANVKRIRIHDFRHSCASLLINKGASIALVSKYLGHGNVSITLNTYTHMYQSELEKMTEILNKLK